MRKVTLSPDFLATGLIGFTVCFFLGLYNAIPVSWATAFGIVFLLMIIASFMSMEPPKVI